MQGRRLREALVTRECCVCGCWREALLASAAPQLMKCFDRCAYYCSIFPRESVFWVGVEVKGEERARWCLNLNYR